MIIADVSDLLRWADGLRAVPVPTIVGPVLSKAGAQMRDDMREHAPAGPHLRKYRSQLWFRKSGALAVEAGAFGGQQGRLAAVLEFGQGPNAPHPHILPTIDHEVPRVIDYLPRALAEALR